MARGIRRFIIATVAGAGLGAGAALARRRAMRAFDHPEGPGDYAEAPAQDAAPDVGVDAAPAAPAVETSADQTEPPTPAAPERVDAISDHAAHVRSEIEALASSVADLEEARNRLRLRAAQLRAEMEGQDHDG